MTLTDNAARLYLDLLKRILTRVAFLDREFADITPRDQFEYWMQLEASQRGYRMMKQVESRQRIQGRDWPTTAETMIGLPRLDNIQHCVEQVLSDGVPGDLLEAGVWRGGAAIFMRAILAAYGVRDRCVWAADSFQGFRAPNVRQYPADAQSDLHRHPFLAVSLEQVNSNFDRYGLLDDQVRFLPGWFSDSLPAAPISRLAVLRLDGDYYESTHDALNLLEPKVAPGGFVIVDDYHAMKCCAEAVHDYRARMEIKEPIREIDHIGVYWRKGEANGD